MHIRRIVVEGFMPFAGSHELELPTGPIAVVARHLGNPRRSNWAGKTSLIDAIRWCLFGVHRKRLDDAIINRTAERCLVEVDLGAMVVTRHRKRGSSTVLLVAADGETFRGPAAQRAILDRLCMSLDDYVATVDFKQDDVESIVGMRTRDRREVIACWLRLERWAVAAKLAADLSRSVMQRLVELRVAAETVAASLEDEAELDTSVRRLDELLEINRAELTRTETATHEIGDPDELERRIAEMARLRARAAVLKTRLKDTQKLDGERDRAREAVAQATASQARTEQRFTELRGIRGGGFDGTCPITCARCPAATEVSDHVARTTDLIDAAALDDVEATAELDAARAELTRLDEAVRARERDSAELTSVVQRGKELAERVGRSTDDDVAEWRKRREELERRRVALRQEIEDEVAEQARTYARLDASRTARVRANRVAVDLVEAERMARVASLVVRALGSSGVPTRIARTHIAQLETAANELLVDSGLAVEFAWERATRELEPTCGCGNVYVGQRDKACPRCGVARGFKMSDELEILVDDASGEVEDVKMKSGGARVLVASALRLAASAMLRDVRGTPVGWATIDEPFGPLDAENREHLARVFSAMLGSVGLEQALVVSHDLALLDALPSRIVIERAGDVSTLRLEAA